jgi:methionyl-tRNA synthetase
VAEVLRRMPKPEKAVVTAGMPYANGPLHLGHLAGAHLPADIAARFLGMSIGRENVLFVSGSDEHGTTSEVAARAAGSSTREFVDAAHAQQAATLQRYEIGLDVYSGTSQPECFEIHRAQCHEFLRRLWHNGLLEKRTSLQWYDPEARRFLPDRLVRGRCPNPKCDNENAYSDECERCGHQYEPGSIKNPRSAISDATPVLRETVHLWLNMAEVSETLREWIESRSKVWRDAVSSESLERVRPALRFDRTHEPAYKQLGSELAKHKRKYTAGQQVLLQFGNRPDLLAGRAVLDAHGIPSTLVEEWGHRPITRDVEWGMPLPKLEPTLDAELAGKTLYVWPDSLIAPISFSQLALQKRGEDPETYAQYWKNPKARVVQFLGQDNVFFYVLMQGAMWLGTQSDPKRQPIAGELQLTDVYSCFHLRVAGEKMSKSTGNFFTGDQLLNEKGYSPDQIRYYLALLGLADQQSDFELAKLDERNRFLAGPLNAAFERPISAAHSKYGSRVPEGQLLDEVVSSTLRIVQRYVRAMDRFDYPGLLFEIENYARSINSLFARFKPHDDRKPEAARKDALFSSFHVLKNLMIMLYPFVPDTMDRLRQSLQLPPEVFRLDQLGTGIPAGHSVGALQQFFPIVAGAAPEGGEADA